MRTRLIQNAILDILQDYKKHTMQDICNELEISRSTCLRHINDLALHYNIQTYVGGRNGGVRLIGEQKVSVEHLNTDDLQLIISKLSLLQDDNPRIKSFIHKLSAQKDLKETIYESKIL